MGGRERISMVTCFRPKSPYVRDENVLTGVRVISYKEQLYAQYAEYRLEILEERIRAKIKDERERERGNGKFDIEGARRWLMEQRDFPDGMVQEMY